MKKILKKSNFPWLHNKKIMSSAVLCLLICFAVAATVTSNRAVLPHNGDVLVDSLNLTGVTSEAAASAPEEATETATGVSGSAAVMTVTSDDLTELENTEVYFQELRAGLDMDRNQIISMLTDVIADAETEGEKDNAAAQKLKIIAYMDTEQVVENLLTAKGLPESLVVMTDNAVNVTVNQDSLTDTEVAQITDIVLRETGRSASQLVIQTK